MFEGVLFSNFSKSVTPTENSKLHCALIHNASKSKCMKICRTFEVYDSTKKFTSTITHYTCTVHGIFAEPFSCFILCVEIPYNCTKGRPE